jgi:hypothetical protein
MHAVRSVDENLLVDPSSRPPLVGIRRAVFADAFKLVPDPVDRLQVDRTTESAVQLFGDPLQLGIVARLQEFGPGTAVPMGVQRPRDGVLLLFMAHPRRPHRRQFLDRLLDPNEPALVIELRLD